MRAADGLDTSDAAMATAQAAWEEANKAAIEAWNALFITAPTTFKGVVELIRHIGDSQADSGGVAGVIGPDEALYVVADPTPFTRR